MVDNVKNIKELMCFEKEGDFYFLQIFRRRKDNPDLQYPVIRVKSYCVYSWDEFNELLPEIKNYCDKYNARAYIRLNKQNVTDVALRCIEEITKLIREGNSKNARKVWDSVSGQKGKNDFWVLDVDNEHLFLEPKIVQHIEEQLILHFADVRGYIDFTCRVNKTKSGYHIIVPPFDKRVMDKINKKFMNKGIPRIQIQHDANTLLYTP